MSKKSSNPCCDENIRCKVKKAQDCDACLDPDCDCQCTNSKKKTK